MYQDELLAKLEEAGLVGRGGAAFPVHLKWQRIKQLENPKKYVVCNASEGELGVKKDFHILENFPQEVLKGMLLAMDFLGTKEGYFYINRNYYKELKSKIDPLIESCRSHGYLLNVFEEEPSYIGGETGSLLNAIEGKKAQPRSDSPSPSVRGIFGNPVLLHNVETFYDIAQVSAAKFKQTRFATILGGSHEGVFEVPIKQTVVNILRATSNYPDFPFFVLVGGGASGETINSQQAETAFLSGCGSVEIYQIQTTAHAFLSKIFNFYAKESCGKCTPCRDGSWQLKELLKNLDESSEVPWSKISPIIEVMDKSSFCALGKSIASPVRSYARNVLGMEV
jgi:NADH:ubiquinone oxidoreductase subunit F (NADH-binding)